jgi:hypothetical protein
MNKEEKQAILKIAGTLDAVIANFDQHLKEDHKMELHGYEDREKPATLRYYLQNCHDRLMEDLEPFRDTVKVNPIQEQNPKSQLSKDNLADCGSVNKE